MRKPPASNALAALAAALALGDQLEQRLPGRVAGMKIGNITTTTEQSGSLGGLVGSNARGGVKYYRARVRPSNPRTGAQTNVRATLSGIAAAWRNTLTNAQRAAWSAIAGAGESGIDRYTAANTVVQQGGTARQDTAPASAVLPWLVVPPVADLDIILAGGILSVGLSGDGTDYIAAPSRFSFYVQDREQPPSRQFPVGNLRYVGSTTSAGVAPVALIAAVATNPAWPGLNGIAIGERLRMRVLAYNADGRVAGDVEDFVTVA